MEWSVPTDLNDKEIVMLRAAVTRAKKDLDEVTTEISEQASVISTALRRVKIHLQKLFWDIKSP